MIRTHFIGIVWHWQAIIRGPFQRTLLLPVIFWTASKSKPSLLLTTEMTTSGPNFLINYMSMKPQRFVFQDGKVSLAEKMMREDV